jgi:hypothetical protein
VQIGAVLFGRGRTVRTRPGGSWDLPKLARRINVLRDITGLPAGRK